MDIIGQQSSAAFQENRRCICHRLCIRRTFLRAAARAALNSKLLTDAPVEGRVRPGAVCWPMCALTPHHTRCLVRPNEWSEWSEWPALASFGDTA